MTTEGEQECLLKQKSTKDLHHQTVISRRTAHDLTKTMQQHSFTKTQIIREKSGVMRCAGGGGWDRMGMVEVGRRGGGGGCGGGVVWGTWADQGVRPPGLPHNKPHWNTHLANRLWKYTTYILWVQ